MNHRGDCYLGDWYDYSLVEDDRPSQHFDDLLAETASTHIGA